MITGYPDEAYCFHHHKRVSYSVRALFCPCSFTLGEETATHSFILAWKIPWTEKPGGLQFMGSQRVRHDWAHITALLYIFLCPHLSFTSHWIKKKKKKQAVSLFYKPYILIYSSFLKHTILELWPEVIFCTYHICVDKQDIELNNDNDKLVSERRRCWKSHVKLIWWSSCIRDRVHCHRYCKQSSWWYCVCVRVRSVVSDSLWPRGL